MKPTWTFEEGIWTAEHLDCTAEIEMVQIDEDGTTVWHAEVFEPSTNTEDAETQDPTDEGLAYLKGWCAATMYWMGVEHE